MESKEHETQTHHTDPVFAAPGLNWLEMSVPVMSNRNDPLNTASSLEEAGR